MSASPPLWLRGRACPIASGRTIGGIARQVAVAISTSNPQARISSTVARLQRQPQAKRRQGPLSRSCQRASRAESARTCSTNSNSPSGRRTRAISSSAHCGSSSVHSTSVATIVSTEWSASGSRSADASTICAARPLARTRRASRRRIAASGSTNINASSPSG